MAILQFTLEVETLHRLVIASKVQSVVDLSTLIVAFVSSGILFDSMLILVL